MGIKRSTKRMIDLRKAPKDIVEGMRRNGAVGSRFNALAKIGRKLVGLLKSDSLK